MYSSGCMLSQSLAESKATHAKSLRGRATRVQGRTAAKGVQHFGMTKIIEFEVIIPILQDAKTIEIEYGPLYGRSQTDGQKHWKMFKYKESNQMLKKDKLSIARYTIHYRDIQKYTAKYYDSLWSTPE